MSASETRPPIFTLILEAVVGELGRGTAYHHHPECPVCNIADEPDVLSVEYVFDRWGGHDLITAMGVYCVSDRLRAAMEKEAIQGVSFKPMTVSKAEYFELEEGAYSEDLPPFHWMVVAGTADAPPTWAVPKKCPACGVVSYKPTKIGLDALSLGGPVIDPLPLREVYRDSWSGADFFELPEKYRPVITDKLKAIFDSFQLKDVSYAAAAWVDRPPGP